MPCKRPSRRGSPSPVREDRMEPAKLMTNVINKVCSTTKRLNLFFNLSVLSASRKYTRRCITIKTPGMDKQNKTIITGQSIIIFHPFAIHCKKSHPCRAPQAISADHAQSTFPRTICHHSLDNPDALQQIGRFATHFHHS
ncbi:Uncharacterised protein [Legionella pneumophila]|nr:Uncharacterised protein [Legionella pneumophila]